MDLSSGVREACWENFKLCVKGNEDKARDKPGGGTPLFEGQCKVLWSAIAVEWGDGGPCSSKDERIINMLEIPEAEDNRKMFVQISNKRTAKENLHPL